MTTRRAFLAAVGLAPVSLLVGPPSLASAATIRVAPNFRRVRGVRAVYRSDDLDGVSSADKRQIQHLGIRLMVAMNSGSDPHIGGVTNRRYRISTPGSKTETYRSFVSKAKQRKAIGRVLHDVAWSTHPVVIHYKEGKDRTGWVSELLQAEAGVSRKTRDADYLATRRYSGGSVDLDWLNTARRRVASEYGSVHDYLRACGLSEHTIRRLKARVS